ncbi:MAG: metallophosphoesterase family protein [Verrucomicrobium sp.]|nr:metallophosphoesterase family protein [Verrucomicrobium sp.]
MRTFAIGDIHGCNTALQILDEQLQFGTGDVIVTLGDYVDRGPDTKGVINHLLKLRNRVTLLPLRGNHEVMMLESRTDRATRLAWYDCGGAETLESYGVKNLSDIPERHWAFLESTLPVYETATDIFVHANLRAHLPPWQQPESVIYWERLQFCVPHKSGRRMICGHTPQKDGAPLNLGYAVCIDTHAYGTGWLTCLDVSSGKYWQANELGQFREGELGAAVEKV